MGQVNSTLSNKKAATLIRKMLESYKEPRGNGKSIGSLMNIIALSKAIEVLESSNDNSLPESCNDLDDRLNGIADDHDLTDLTDGQFEALKHIWNDGYCSAIEYAKNCIDKLIKKEE